MLERLQLDLLRERVAGERDVVIAENDVRVPEPLEQQMQDRLAARARQKVAGEADQVGTTLLDPAHSELDRPASAGRDAEMEVRKMGDPQPVELGRQSGQRDFEHTKAHPTRFEPCVREPDRRHGGRPDEDQTPRSDLKLLDDRLHRDDMPLELELRLLQPCGDADEL